MTSLELRPAANPRAVRAATLPHAAARHCVRWPFHLFPAASILGAMSELASDTARQKIAERITAIEKASSAEVVVVMTKSSGHYRHADLAFAALVALATLCVFLYSPEEFDFTFFPLQQLGAFVLGAMACAHVAPLRRLMSSRRVRETNVARAAKAAFVERGIHKTASRGGVLVYISAFERDAGVVLDVGLDEARLGDPLAKAKEALRVAVHEGKLADFDRALAEIGARLAEVYPVRADDVDELPNEVAA
jgi:putative membrane protein